jgi:hypothetical protein
MSLGSRGDQVRSRGGWSYLAAVPMSDRDRAWSRGSTFALDTTSRGRLVGNDVKELSGFGSCGWQERRLVR